MSNEHILLIIAGLLLLIIIVYKLPIRRCPKCKGDVREVVHTFPGNDKIPAKEMHYYECEKCKSSWDERIVAPKKKNSPSH